MNVRTATVFFWGILVAIAAMASEEDTSGIKIGIEGESPQVVEWRSNDSDAECRS
jgi:hypothetical protein